MLSGLSMFHPLLSFLALLFGSGQWARAIHPWIGCVLLVSYAGLIIQFWRDNFWNRDDVAWMGAIVRVLRNEEEGVPEVGRFNAGQKFVFWSMALLVPALFLTGLVIWEYYFGEATSIETQRAAALIHSYAAIAAIIIWITHVYAAIWVRGLDARDDARLCDPRLGVASSPQMAQEPRRDRLAGPSSSACCRGFMRQGEATPKSGWIGSATGGVKAPEPILLPDAAVRFARTAERLERLSKGHPMEGWLDFMAKVARAQHHVATMLPPFAAPDQAAVEQAVAARIPPISADGHRRDPAWRDGLALLLDTAVGEGLPPPAAAVAAELRARSAASTETQADAFLRGVIDEADAGFSFWIAAALQVYFTRLAGRLSRAGAAAARTTVLMPLLRLDPLGEPCDPGRAKSRRALSLLLALLHGVELLARRLRHLRRLADACDPGNRRRFRPCEGGDLRRVLDLLEDAVRG